MQSYTKGNNPLRNYKQKLVKPENIQTSDKYESRVNPNGTLIICKGQIPTA